MTKGERFIMALIFLMVCVIFGYVVAHTIAFYI